MGRLNDKGVAGSLIIVSVQCTCISCCLIIDIITGPSKEGQECLDRGGDACLES